MISRWWNLKLKGREIPESLAWPLGDDSGRALAHSKVINFQFQLPRGIPAVITHLNTEVIKRVAKYRR